MKKKVIKKLSILFFSLIFILCFSQSKKYGVFSEIKDSKDSTKSLERIKIIKKLNFSEFKEGEISDKSLKLNFRFLEPENLDKKKKYPLIVVFHGSGAIGTNNSSQMGILSKMWLLPENRKNYPAFVYAPQFPVRSSNYHLDKTRNVLVSESNEYLDLLLDNILMFSKIHNVDRDRIYVIGFSMGGATVSNAISKRPDLFAAAVNISGISEFDKLSELENMPIWIVHGGLDTDNRPESNLKFYDELKLKGKVFFWKYDDKYHNNILSAGLVKEIPTWLFKQYKNKKN